MLDSFLTGTATWFTIPAFVGTALFLIRLATMLLGHGVDFDHDGALDAAGADVPDAHHSDSADAFKILSLQTLAAFAMGFGWAGLGALRGTEWAPWVSVPVGIVGGVAMVWLLAILLKGAHELQSSGNVPIRSAIGAEGTVYVSVPGEGSGRGQVQLVVNNQQCFFNAVTDGPAITSRSRVRVVGVNDDNTLSVVAV